MRLTFFVILILVLNLNNYSQTSIGIKSGINFSKAVYLSDYNEELINPIRKLKPGVVAGIFISQSLNKIISVQAEFLYSQKGLKVIQQPFHKSINTMNYIEVPLTGHYSVVKRKHSSLNLYIGGYAAYWTDGKYKRTDLGTEEITILKVDFNNLNYTFNRIDAGIIGGFVYKTKKSDFFVRYIHSMLGSSQINADALSNKVISIGMNFSLLK
ncbi:MAG: PorT family protein [Bacteroidales bacterium]|nr:PorT family protein [Bacteroidales bacterium]